MHIKCETTASQLARHAQPPLHASKQCAPSQKTSTREPARRPPVGVAQLRRSDGLMALDTNAAGTDGAVQTRIAAAAAQAAAADHMAAASSAVPELVVALQVADQPHPPSSAH